MTDHKNTGLPKLEYEKRPEWTEMQHPWHGKPLEELDTAWDDLLYGMVEFVVSLLDDG